MNAADRLATLTQRSVEAEEAWRRKAATDAAWEKARQQLAAAIEDVRELVTETTDHEQ